MQQEDAEARSKQTWEILLQKSHKVLDEYLNLSEQAFLQIKVLQHDEK